MSPLGLEPAGTGLAAGSTVAITPGTGGSVPHGVDSIMEIGGIYLNIRNQIDTFIVNEVGGLEDADLRDDREVNPQAHGETFFDAFYGGRTITLTGYIRAFTLEKLRDMQQGLKQALMNLSGEQPLVFHRYGDPSTDVMIMVRKGAPLQMNEVQSDHNYFRREFMITLRASNPRFLGLADQYATAAFATVDTFPTGGESNYDSTGGGFSFTGGQFVPTSTAAKQLIRKLNTGFVLGADSTQTIKYMPDATFTSSTVKLIAKWLDANNYIYGQVDAAGVLTVKKVDGGVTSTLATGSTTPARSAGGYWVRLRTNSNTVTYEHFTVDPRVDLAAVPNATVSHTLAGGDALKFGFGVVGRLGMETAPGSTAWRYDDWSLGTYNALALSALIATNVGNFGAQPEITFSNKMTDPSLINTLNGQQLSIETALAALSSRTANIAQWTLKDQGGVNRFNELGITSDWMEISPGDNPIKFTATAMFPVFANGQWNIPGITVKHRHSWF